MILVSSADQYLMHWKLKNKMYVPTQLCIVTFGRKILLGTCRWLAYTLKHEILLSLNHDLGLQSCKFYVNSHKMIHPIFIFRLSICLNSSLRREFYKLLSSCKKKSFLLFQIYYPLIELRIVFLYYRSWQQRTYLI